MAGRLSEAARSRKHGGDIWPPNRTLSSATARMPEMADAQDAGTVCMVPRLSHLENYDFGETKKS